MACKWCGTALSTPTPEFCPTCKGPQTGSARFLYAMGFLAKNLAIPLAIGLVTFFLATGQQNSALIVASREKLAEALGDIEKEGADYRRAYTQILFMATSGGTTVPAKDVKDAATRIDVTIASFGSRLGPFEEFARRTKYYDIKEGEASPLQKVWDRCFVYNYWDHDKKPGYLTLITQSLAKCDDTSCPKAVAQELKHFIDEFYQGYCQDKDPVPNLEQVWFNRELRRIFIQEPRSATDIYTLGRE